MAANIFRRVLGTSPTGNIFHIELIALFCGPFNLAFGIQSGDETFISFPSLALTVQAVSIAERQMDWFVPHLFAPDS